MSTYNSAIPPKIKCRKTARVTPIDWAAADRILLNQTLIGILLELVRIWKRRHSVILRFYLRYGTPDECVSRYVVDDLDDLRGFLKTAPIGPIWYQLEDGRDRDFPFNERWEFTTLCRILALLFFYDRADLDIDCALTLDPQAVIDRLGTRRISMRRLQQPVTVGKRSSVIWKLACIVHDAGATKNEAACLIAASAAWRSKHGSGRQPLKLLIDKIWRRR